MLVLCGFMTIYTVVGLRGGAEPTTLTFSAVGFGFMLALAGVVLFWREMTLASCNTTDAELPLPSADIELAVTQLNKNYEILRRQASQGFMFAGIFMAIGLLVILAGSLGDMFGFVSSAGKVTVVAGVVVEAVSALGLYLFRQTFHRLNVTSDRLHDTWKILAAFKKVELLSDDRKSEMTCTLITKLIEPSHDRSFFPSPPEQRG